MKRILSILICAAVLMTAGIRPAKADLWNDIKNGVSGIVDAAGEAASSAAGWVNQQAESASAFIDSAAGWVEGAVNDSITWIGQAFSDVSDWATVAIEDVLTWTMTSISSAENGISEMVNYVIGLVNGKTDDTLSKLKETYLSVCEKAGITSGTVSAVWNQLIAYATEHGITPEKLISIAVSAILGISPEDGNTATQTFLSIIDSLTGPRGVTSESDADNILRKLADFVL